MYQEVPNAEKRSAWMAPAVLTTLFLGIVLSVTIYFILENKEQRDMAGHFKNTMKVKTISIRRELELNSQVLNNIKGLFNASTFVSRQDFKIFTAPVLERHPEIKALEWIPRVSLSKKALYIKKAQQDGFQNFKFTRKNQTGSMAAQTREKPFYFPVYYLEPHQGNEAAFGFDLSSNPERNKALKKSWESGKKIATQRITLVQAGKKQYGVLIFIPVYQGRSSDRSQRIEYLTGFVLGVYQIADIIDTAIDYVKTQIKLEEIHFLVTDISTPAHPQILYKNNPEETSVLQTGTEFREIIKVADRLWEIRARPGKKFNQSRKQWTPFISGLSSFLVAILMATYMKQRVSELQENKTRSRSIIDNVINGIITIDHTGRIESFNHASEIIFQYTFQEVIGRNVKMLMSEYDRTRHHIYMTNYLTTGEKRIIGTGREVTGRRKDGTLFPMDLAINEMIIGNEKKFAGIITDITERKAAEQALVVTKNQAEEASRLKSEFLNVMSHELRTPLTVMLGNIPLLTDPEDLPNPDEIAEIADDIESSGQHLLILINDLLDISKIEAGQMQLNTEPIQIRDIVDESVSAIQALATQKKITIEQYIEDVELFADPLRIKQILINILGNAVKFTDKGWISIQTTQGNHEAEISITDTGCGINQEDLKHIFEKFKQVDGSATRAASGTGLGLAITKKLVKLHHGTISAESCPGKGSTFRISIPYGEALGEKNSDH